MLFITIYQFLTKNRSFKQVMINLKSGMLPTDRILICTKIYCIGCN